MKKTVVALTLTAAVMAIATPAMAESGITLGVGHANIQLSVDGAREKMRGVNIYSSKEWDGKIGGILSATSSQKSINSGKLSYYDVMAGPSYRFNEYVKAYALLGTVGLKASSKAGGSSSKLTFGYGAGVQFYPTHNFAINLGYVRSSVKLNDVSLKIKINTWYIGMGYQF